MAREAAFDKARRLLVEGRVNVKRVNAGAVIAEVRGDGGRIYLVSGDDRGWACPCDAVTYCSHAMAVALVTLLPLPMKGPGP
jgi:uncharacterized Zn finger protein